MLSGIGKINICCSLWNKQILEMTVLTSSTHQNRHTYKFHDKNPDHWSWCTLHCPLAWLVHYGQRFSDIRCQESYPKKNIWKVNSVEEGYRKGCRHTVCMEVCRLLIQSKLEVSPLLFVTILNSPSQFFKWFKFFRVKCQFKGFINETLWSSFEVACFSMNKTVIVWLFDSSTIHLFYILFYTHIKHALHEFQQGNSGILLTSQFFIPATFFF